MTNTLKHNRTTWAAAAVKWPLRTSFIHSVLTVILLLLSSCSHFKEAVMAELQSKLCSDLWGLNSCSVQ